MKPITDDMEWMEAHTRLLMLRHDNRLVTERMIRELDGCLCPLSYEMRELARAIGDYQHKRSEKEAGR